MQVVETLEALHQARGALNGRVGVVLTMGALHAGHLKLVEMARSENDYVLTTIFVNPTQFAQNEDLSKYPRDLPRDLKMLEDAGADVVFTPTPNLMYPEGYQTWIEVTELTQGLEGEHRPGHFRGVATVVAKLFNLTQPYRSYFGQKDAQQVAVIKQMARDLNFPLEVVVCPTVREEDGLAMSSRNVYLSFEQRKAAPVLYQALAAAGDEYDKGQRDPSAIREVMVNRFKGEPLAQVEYVSVADAANLRELNEVSDKPMLLSMGVRFGTTRLIDNLLLPTKLNNRDDLSGTLGG